MTMTLQIGKLAGLAGFFTLATAFAAVEARADYQDIYSAGHADVNVGFDAGSRSLTLNYEFASNAVINGSVIGPAGAGERDADTITVLLGANSLGTGRAGLPAPFAGNPLFILPQNSSPGRPFLGFGAETIEMGLFREDNLVLTLTGASRRPAGGEVVLFQIGNEANPFFNSADGFSTADHIDLLATGHDHYTLGFTTEGTYDLNFTASGTLLDGTALSTSETFRFQVGASPQAVPEPASLAMLGLGVGSIGLIIARRGKGRPAPVAKN